MGSQFIKCVYVKDTIQNSVYCEPLKVKIHRDIFLSKHICRQFKVYFIFSGFRQIFKIPEITQEITQKKSLLYYNKEPWVQKGERNFDVSWGAYDGAEVCELIGIFMLSLLSKRINKNHVGLYGDDGLAILKNTSGPEAAKLKKKFQKLF